VPHRVCKSPRESNNKLGNGIVKEKTRSQCLSLRSLLFDNNVEPASSDSTIRLDGPKLDEYTVQIWQKWGSSFSNTTLD
jgi:hypothetical protein